jgi:purine-nucleoside phosphorylase
VWDRVEEAAAVLRGRGGAPPQAAVVLGSGLGEFSERLLDAVSTSYGNLPHWPVPSAVGHEGRIVVGTIGGKRIAVLSGRVHFYEGHDAEQVIFATRVVGRLGVKQIILTNAAGGNQCAVHGWRVDGDRRSHQLTGSQSADGAE